MRPEPRADFLVAGAAAAVFLITLVTVPDTRCTAARPCAAEPLTAIALTMPIAVAVMSFAHRWTAVVGAVACAGVWVAADRAYDGQMGWRVLLPLLLVAATVWVARLRPMPTSRDRRSRPSPGRRPRAPRPRSGRGRVVAGGALLLIGLLTTGWTIWQQERVTAQEAAARSVYATVSEHRDNDGAVLLTLPDGTFWIAEVLSASAYPIGSETELLIDGDGLRQLWNEPYDITALFLLTVPVLGLGAALSAAALGRFS